jgi:myo-inositol-1(or 4)-monophosphatase
MPYRHELDVALEAGREAGEILRRHWQGVTESWEKSADNPVTKADLEADRAIVAKLRAAFPLDAMLSEETACDAGRTERRRAWIVDPMDGTKEFIARIPEFAVSIALVEDGEPVVGVIVNPAARVAVFATRGGGAWRAGLDDAGSASALQAGARRAEVSRCVHLDQAVLIASRTEISRQQLSSYTTWCREIVPVGSIAWKLACIACGEGDLNVSVAPKNEWDVCAGDLLVREAGGIYCAFDGTRRRYNQADPLIAAGMVAGPLPLVDAFRAREAMRKAAPGPPPA